MFGKINKRKADDEKEAILLPITDSGIKLAMLEAVENKNVTASQMQQYVLESIGLKRSGPLPPGYSRILEELVAREGLKKYETGVWDLPIRYMVLGHKAIETELKRRTRYGKGFNYNECLDEAIKEAPISRPCSFSRVMIGLLTSQ